MSWPPKHSELVLEGKIEGEAKTAGSKKAFVVRSKKAPNPRTGKPDGRMHPIPVGTRDGTTVKASVVDDTGAAGKAWRKKVQAAVDGIWEAGAQEGPVVLEVVFFRPRGKGMYGTGANARELKESAPAYPTARPDGTKLSRAFEDALSERLWADDSLIVSERWDKRFIPIDQPERVEFRLWKLPATIAEKRMADQNQEQATLV